MFNDPEGHFNLTGGAVQYYFNGGEGYEDQALITDFRAAYSVLLISKPDLVKHVAKTIYLQRAGIIWLCWAIGGAKCLTPNSPFRGGHGLPIFPIVPASLVQPLAAFSQPHFAQCRC